MEEQMDKKFREGLSHHRKDPPPGIWEGITGSMQFASGTPKPQRKKKPFWWITLAGVLLLPASLWLLWFLIYHQPDISLQTSPKQNARVTTYPHITSSSTEKNQPITPEKQATNKGINEPKTTIAENIVSSPLSVQTVTKEKQTTATATTETMVPLPAQANPDKPEPESAKAETSDPEKLQTSEPKVAERQPEIQPVKPDIVQKETQTEGNRDTINHHRDTAEQKPLNVSTDPVSRVKLLSPPKPVHLFAALLAGPVLYEDHSPYTERIRGAGEGALLGKFQYNRFYFSTGAGISSFTDRNPSRLTLERTDTVGFYNYVTSVQFQPVYDSTNTTIIGYTPVNIITQTHVVIDTVRLYEEKTLRTRYTYLQVPLMVGYEIVQKPAFSLALQGGMVYLRMLDEDRKIPVYPEGTLLVAIENLAWQRKKQFWYYQAGVQAKYYLSDQWFAGLSLNVGQPAQSIYKNTENPVKPMSFHLGGSVGIRLR